MKDRVSTAVLGEKKIVWLLAVVWKLKRIGKKTDNIYYARYFEVNRMSNTYR